jgi:hypothetical protein
MAQYQQQMLQARQAVLQEQSKENITIERRPRD